MQLICTPNPWQHLSYCITKKMPYVQTLCSLNHSRSQSINKLEDHLENLKVPITVNPFSCLTVNDMFQVSFSDKIALCIDVLNFKVLVSQINLLRCLILFP